MQLSIHQSNLLMIYQDLFVVNLCSTLLQIQIWIVERWLNAFVVDRLHKKDKSCRFHFFNLPIHRKTTEKTTFENNKTTQRDRDGIGPQKFCQIKGCVI